MNKKISLVTLVIALVGVLIYILSSGTQPEKSLVVPDKPASAVSGNQSVTAEQSLVDEQQPPREIVDSSADDIVTSPVVPPAQQQAPALEPEIREALGNMLNTSSEGLVEETRNGVTSVDLQGRFQTAPVATIDEDGNVQITDYSHLPEASTQP